jgi:DNA helicase-2/ATP-dependent DNA helicase PcrA
MHLFPPDLPAVEPILSLNPEQRAAAEHGEGALLVIAGAGSGKTRVLTARVAHLLARGVPPGAVLAFTFTNRAAREMRERIARAVGEAAGRLWVGTFHATGVRILRREAGAGRIPGLDAGFVIYDREDQEAALEEVLAGLGLPEGTLRLGEVLRRISDAKNALVSLEEFERLAVSPHERRIAECYRGYQQALRGQGALDFDDLICEVVRLLHGDPELAGRYRERFRHVLVDEYQDTNRAQFRLVEALASGSGNVFAVGDDDQCLAAGSLVTMADGTTRPIEQVVAGDEVRSAQGVGRFRAARVLRVHRHDQAVEGIEIVTRAGRRLVSTIEHTHFAGYVSGVSPQTYFTYLMFRCGSGFRLGTTRVYTAGQKQPVLGFMLRLAQEGGDALWIVGAHGDEQGARLDEQLLSLRYQIPALPFVPRRNGRPQAGLVHDPVMLSRVFSEFGGEASAQRLLIDRGLSLEHPHYRPRSRNSSRRNVVLTLCADSRGSRPMHRISLVGNDPDGRLALQELGLPVRAAKGGSRSWRHETVRASYAEIQEAVERIRTRFPVNVHQVARLGRSGGARETNSLPFIPAGSVLPGMAMFGEHGEYDVVVSTRPVRLKESVFDLCIEHTHNFIANGLVTHNSIYGWRGADLSNLLDFEDAFPNTTVIRLEQNYRSTANILRAANQVIAHNRERKGKNLWCDKGDGAKLRFVLAADEQDEARRVIGFLTEHRSAGGRLDDAAVLYRTNAQSRALESELRQQGLRYEIVGGISFYARREVKDLLAYLRLAVNPADRVAFWRVWNTPRRGLGEALRTRLESLDAERPLEALRSLAGQGQLKGAARGGAEAFIGLIDELRARIAEPPVELLKLVIERSEYLRTLEESGEGDAADRRANVEELLAAAVAYTPAEGAEGVAGFLAESALITDADRLEEGVDRVLLMTAHNAKGLEFKVVVIAGLEEGLLPHASSLEEARQLEEERRLFYVALTRAQEQVLLTAAAYRRRMTASGAFVARGGQVSRFVDEIPAELLEREESATLLRERSRAWSGAGREMSRGSRDSDHASGPAYRTTGALARTVGREVHHETFGRGVVVMAEGQGSEVKFTVRFPSGTRKVLGRFLTGGTDVDPA